MNKNSAFVLGIILIIIGASFLALLPFLFDFMLNNFLSLAPKSTIYPVWKSTPFPITTDVYLFNWTNPQDVHNASIKPAFDQLGPYRYYETREKANVVWHYRNKSVTYNVVKRWTFDAENSNGSLSDVITTINIISRTVTFLAKEWSYVVRKGVSIALNKIAPDVHVTKTIEQLMFEGYEDPLLTVARTMPFLMNSDIPDLDRIGLFYGRNGSAQFDGVYNMATGKGGPYFGQLLKWQHSSRNKNYPDHCGNLDGSAGDFFPQHLTKDQLKIFSPDICRTMPFDFQEEVVVEGIAGYKYTVGDSFLDNGTKIPENKCYCAGDCQPSGTINVTTCKFGTPAFISLPHFYKGDPFYREIATGFNPEKEKHEFYAVVEPRTGLPLELTGRMQYNVQLEPDDIVGVYTGVPLLYIPLMWIEQKVRIEPGAAQRLYLILIAKPTATIISYTLIAIGVLINVFVISFQLRASKSNKFHPNDGEVRSKEEIPLNIGDDLKNPPIVISSVNRKHAY